MSSFVPLEASCHGSHLRLLAFHGEHNSARLGGFEYCLSIGIYRHFNTVNENNGASNAIARTIVEVSLNGSKVRGSYP